SHQATQKVLSMADWTVFVTNVPVELLSLNEALIIARARWQIELLFKLWKSHGHIDAWRTQKPWRILCEVYAKLIAMLIQHWVLVLFAWHDPQRSLVKLPPVVRDTAWLLMNALAGPRSVSAALAPSRWRIEPGSHRDRTRQRPR